MSYGDQQFLNSCINQQLMHFIDYFYEGIIFFFLKIKNSPIQVVDYVGVLVFPHHQNFIDDQLFLGLLLQVHLLNGHLRRQKKNSCVPHNNKMCERLCERTETNRTMFHLLASCNVNGSVHSARGSARTHGKSSQ